MRLERLEDRLVGGDPGLAVVVAHERERLVERPLAALERDLQRREHLVEERVPGADRGRLALGQHVLLGLGAGVRPEAPHALEVVAVLLDELAGGELGCPVVVDLEPLELEEAERVLGLDHPLLDGGVQVALGLAGDVDRQRQPGVRADPREPVVEVGEGRQGRGQARGVELGDVAAVLLAEGLGVGEGAGQRILRGGVVDEQGGEVPVDAGARVGAGRGVAHAANGSRLERRYGLGGAPSTRTSRP